MKRLMMLVAVLGALLGNLALAEESRETVPVLVGKTFIVKDIAGVDAEALILKKEGKYYIRSEYRHGQTKEERDYPIPRGVRHAFLLGRGICIFYEDDLKGGPAGIVYAINNHGAAVKVDDITATDLVW